MKTNEFKQLIKESVREVFKEEIKDILLEALKTSKPIIKENINLNNNSPQVTKGYMDIMKDMQNNLSNINTSTVPFTPRAQDTISEGSSLPPGEVSLDQIHNLFKGK